MATESPTGWAKNVTLFQWARSLNTHIQAAEGRAIRAIQAGRVTDAQKVLGHIELTEEYGTTVFGPGWREYVAANPEPPKPAPGKSPAPPGPGSKTAASGTA
jgi:hypothetical protein